MRLLASRHAARAVALAALLAAGAVHAAADPIVHWNRKAGELIAEAKLGTPPAVRAMAILQTAALDAVEMAGGGTQRPGSGSSAASVEAAVAAVHRAALSKLLPTQQAAIDAAYGTALAAVADGPAKAAGIAIGEKAAAAVLAARAADGALPGDSYRPHTTAGAYVPTAAPAAAQWAHRKPWLMTDAAQFRPAAPPALTSDAWARDFAEVKAIGGTTSSQRTAEQTEIARFWEYSLPSIYHGVVQSVATMPGRDVAQNARLYAAAAQAMDDALIAVFDAKYHHNLWRPVTAIRNADIDGHDATVRDPSWSSLIPAPLHPEYPSGHGILAGAVGAVLKAELAGAAMPVLSTASPSAKGAVRRWTSVDAFVREVCDSRIYAGIHYRFSVDAAAAMGRRIGELAAGRFLH